MPFYHRVGLWEFHFIAAHPPEHHACEDMILRVYLARSYHHHVWNWNRYHTLVWWRKETSSDDHGNWLCHSNSRLHVYMYTCDIKIGTTTIEHNRSIACQGAMNTKSLTLHFSQWFVYPSRSWQSIHNMFLRMGDTPIDILILELRRLGQVEKATKPAQLHKAVQEQAEDAWHCEILIPVSNIGHPYTVCLYGTPHPRTSCSRYIEIYGDSYLSTTPEILYIRK